MKKCQHILTFSREELKECAVRQKFCEQSQQAIFVEVYEQILPMVKAVYYITEEAKERSVVMTLGKQIDCMQEQYLKQGEYLKAYSIECLGMELLMKFYEHLRSDLKKEGWYIKQFLYPGEQLPMESMSEIFQSMTIQEITYNQAFVMNPKNSVAMKLVLAREEEKETCGICDTCTNQMCPARRLSGRR